MPFKGPDCYMRNYKDEKGPLTHCARSVLVAHAVDPTVPLCENACDVVGEVGLHDKCPMSLTAPFNISSGFSRHVEGILRRLPDEAIRIVRDLVGAALMNPFISTLLDILQQYA